MDLQQLQGFKLDRILDQDSFSKSITLLGTLPIADERVPAIVMLQKTPFDSNTADEMLALLDRADAIEHNDIYHWFFGWLGGHKDSATSDVKINVIAPATEVHIRKYSAQKYFIISETPSLYQSVTLPYISAFPASRIQWVYNILTHKTESEHILHEDPSPSLGYILLPDAKWDRKTLSSLYLVAIAHDRNLRTLRDLKRSHVGMLRSIKREAERVVGEKWGLEGGRLRCYVHYQPSYYQFHVHIVTTEFVGLSGMNVGQAHLLEDIISLLELSPEEGPSLLEKMTLSYVIGEKHGLFESLKAAGALGDPPSASESV